MARSTTDIEDRLPLTTLAFEILLSVAGGERYGYQIMQAIERRTEGTLRPNPGTLYRALDRLVREGLLESVSSGPHDPKRREPKRSFRLSALGERVAAAEAERLADQVDAAKKRRLLPERGR